jgi:outer membrane PBP1 activator LpoA protein
MYCVALRREHLNSNLPQHSISSQNSYSKNASNYPLTQSRHKVHVGCVERSEAQRTTQERVGLKQKIQYHPGKAKNGTSTLKIKLLISALLLTTLAACAVVKPQTNYSYSINKLPGSVNSYLAQASNATTPTQQMHFRFLATQKMLEQGDTNAAGQELKQLQPNVTTTAQQNLYSILNAYLDLELDKPRAALNQLYSVTSSQSLPKREQLIFQKLAYQAYLRNNMLSYSMIAQIRIANLQGNSNPAELHWIFRDLQNLTTPALQNIVKNYKSPLLVGWFKLALISKQYGNNSTQLFNALNQWQQNFPNNPAQQLLPSSSTTNSVLSAAQPKQIALLLPLSGPLAGMGKSVMNGFMTAFYKDRQVSKPSIKVYDTNSADVDTLYQQAVNNGAQLVVGPLTKANVNELISDNAISVPTIALNYTQQQNLPADLIEFGLSPTQAAEQAARQAWQHSISSVVTITPNNAWGQAVLNSFTQTFTGLGGQVVGTLQFQKHNLASQVSNLLEVNKSIQRKNQLQQILGEKLQFIPRKRTDANGVFLVAAPPQAREIRPLLRFYYAGNLPIFSTSFIYAGYPQPELNRDLDGVYFGDMPFVLSNKKNIRQLREPIKKLWGSSFLAYNRLFAVGLDSYTLALRFQRFVLLPHFGIKGMTGRLYLKQQRVDRQLQLALMRNGRVQLTH